MECLIGKRSVSCATISFGNTLWNVGSVQNLSHFQSCDGGLVFLAFGEILSKPYRALIVEFAFDGNVATAFELLMWSDGANSHGTGLSPYLNCISFVAHQFHKSI